MVGKIVGKYRVTDRLGRGGMGTVYRAMDEMLHRDVAIKVLNAELNDPEVARRFRAEAITVARLSHPGIATIYELFEYEGEWLMVMEYVRGETLEAMVARMGPLSPQRAAELCMQALAALAHAHSMGVVHRDLKPANLMITESGAVKVMDFGIARVSGSEHLTSAGFMMGTPAYMAPEQVKGGEIDARADLYAMGVVFYRLTTAALPFKGDTPFALAQSQVLDPPTPVNLVRADLPGWVEEIVTRALAKEPDQRFQSAVEFHEAFARCLAGLTLSSMYTSASGDPTMTPSRAMPSGAFPFRPIATPTPGSIPFPPSTTSSQPTMAAGAKTAAISAPSDPTVAGPSGATQIPTGTTGNDGNERERTGTAGETSTAARTSAGPKKSSSMLWLGIAGAAVLAIAVGAYMFRGGSAGGPAPSPEPSPAQTSGSDALPPTPPPAGGDQTAAVPPPPTTPVTSPAATGAAAKPATTPAAGSAGTKPVSGAGQPSSGGAAAPSAASTTAKPADDPLVTFPDVKLLSVNGKRTTDRDVVLNFAHGQLLVMPRSGGAALATLPYGRITHATYVRARDPKWAPKGAAAPPDDLDVGSLIRTPRHWLVLQGAENYAILRLDDASALRLLETFESRTGLKIERPK